MPGGRPTKFKPEYVEQAAKLCRLGATNTDLAEFFGVDISTVERWATRYEEFRGALKVGKEEADARVERSLYHRAVGYERDAVKIFPGGDEGPVYAPYRESVTPDTTAAIFWLKNRRPEEWRDRQSVEHSGPDGGPIKTEEVSNVEAARRVAFMLAQAAKEIEK